MEALLRDIQSGARALMKKPGSAVISVVVLSLGIGLSAFMFSLVYGVFYRGLGIPEEDRVATIWYLDPSLPTAGGQARPIANHDFADFRERQCSFSGLAAHRTGTVNIGGNEAPRRYQGTYVTANAFDLLQVRPIIGRAFLSGEDTPGAAPTVLLGYDAWQDRYGGDAGVLGQIIRVNGEQGTIVGVMPEGFKWPNVAEMWITEDDDPLTTERWQGRFFQVFGRLNDTVTWDQAGLEFAALAQQLEREHPDTNEGIGIQMMTFVEFQSRGPIKTIFTAMMVAVILVLLVACANVANLLLARAALRTKEAAVRVAMGASRFRVMFPFFAEALVLATAGAVMGIGIAYYTVGLFDAATDPALTGRPYHMVFQVDLPILLFVVGLTGLTALAAGAAPALQVARADVNAILKDESRGSSGFHLGRLAKALVIGEVAFSCALLVGAGLMTKSIVQVSRFEFAFDPEPIFTTRVGLFAADYPDREDRQELFGELVRRVEAIPNVQAVGLMSSLPGTGTGIPRIRLEGVVYDDDDDRPRAHTSTVSPGFFDLLGAQFLQGENFSPAHAWEADRVAVVNQSFQERFWSGESALGRRFRTGTSDTIPWMSVIGVVPDLHMEGFAPAGQPGENPDGYYVPVTQTDPFFLTIGAMAAAGGPMSLAEDVRDAVSSLDPNLPIYNTRGLEEAIHRGRWFYTVFGTVFIVFGVAGLFMASVGLYGVLAFSVSRRVQEMGIRMALGADAGNVFSLILKQGALQIGIGLAIGMVMAWGVSTVLGFIMFNVDPRDASVFATVFGTIVLVGLLASWIPARRATRVDPMVALRYE